MKFFTTRFGNVEIDDKKIITFRKGILGFPDLHEYAILDSNDKSPLKWLQAIKDPAVAFVITDPLIFIPDYKIDVYRSDIEDIGVEKLEDVLNFVIVTVPRNPKKMTANLKGPILINTKNNEAKQLVLDDPKYDLRYRLLADEDMVANG